jgi:ribosomal-protein-alanine N-acetyltransferase
LSAPLRIEPAGPAHATVLAAIHAESFPPAERWDATAIGEQLGLPGTWALLAPAGGFVMWQQAADEAEILTLAVLPALRCAGMGRALMDAAMRAMAASGVAVLFLEVARSNHPARRLYTMLGFAQVGERRRYYADGGDALVLRRDLPMATPRRLGA